MIESHLKYVLLLVRNVLRGLRRFDRARLVKRSRQLRELLRMVYTMRQD